MQDFAPLVAVLDGLEFPPASATGAGERRLYRALAGAEVKYIHEAWAGGRLVGLNWEDQ